ncbi:hypothetical protein QYF36_008834 [Acer negundo]|nr:hypothetical protein QYF36_008834 [Acer negundo]
MGKPLKEQAFATPDKVAELVRKINKPIQQVLPPVTAKMNLYLQNPSTRTILFKPVKTNIVEAHIQVQSLLKSEYSPEEQSLTGSECTTRRDNLKFLDKAQTNECDSAASAQPAVTATSEGFATMLVFPVKVS